MATKSIAEAESILRSARSLDPLQQRILFSLADRGPGLPLEVAVRVLSFPEDVAEPIADLRRRGLITSSSVHGGPLGSEILSLSRRGEQVVEALRDEAAIQESTPKQADVPAQTSADPRQQEVDLLRKLGDIAASDGDLGKAQEYYKEALDAARQIR